MECNFLFFLCSCNLPRFCNFLFQVTNWRKEDDCHAAATSDTKVVTSLSMAGLDKKLSLDIKFDLDIKKLGLDT
jgi:hypothetical protein